ncbi:HDOD domain-containing protein [Methylomonas methanica]|uniref:Putative signal transduction protein n=1 Tax=Methylomonas methanica (strain DSM 25384 / MC09) TaxID=857087 RepID=G0A651_METMM|nr:HDOD domain-containing protein [Methylomonas methanica]AEG00501.1 putative signal transduction protein [Methylomonas methanica MC09]
MNNLLLREKIADSKRIPSLPRQAQQLLQAFNNQDLDYGDLARIISRQPTIAVRLVALANSAWAAPAVPVNSLERACINLGFKVVRSVSIGLALISPFNTWACPAFDIRRFWMSSKLVADASALLASAMPDQPQQAFLQVLYTGGLMHNLGLICLADLMPEETNQALSNLASQPQLTVNQALENTLQTNYCEVGGLFAEIWGLPDDLTAIIKFHRSTDYPENHAELIALISDAAMLVSTLFSDQPELPITLATKKLGIKDTDHQEILENLQPLFLQTNELAKALF